MHDLERWMRHALALAARGRGARRAEPDGRGRRARRRRPSSSARAGTSGSAGRTPRSTPSPRPGSRPAAARSSSRSSRAATTARRRPAPTPCCGPACGGWSRRWPTRSRRSPAAGCRCFATPGVEVEVGLCEAEARRLNAPYLKLLRTGRPWVHAKWAMTLDGKIATRTGDSKWISGEESAARGSTNSAAGWMRSSSAAARCVADDPLLTARPPGPRIAARVVLTASGELPATCQLRATAREVPVIVFTAAGNEAKLAGWAADGAEVTLPGRACHDTFSPTSAGGG